MQLAVIREAECVGCTKCILACPVDAIIGAAQFLHTVITDECIGCGLCVTPCPMDCIDIIQIQIEPSNAEKTERGTKAKQRYQARQNRLISEEQPKLPASADQQQKQLVRAEISAAVMRIQEKRNPLTLALSPRGEGIFRRLAEMNAKQRTEIFKRFKTQNPSPITELKYNSEFELLISVVLSAQATDISVNKATEKLFFIANTPDAILALGEAKLKNAIKTIGLYNTKAKNILKTCEILVEQFHSKVPTTREALESLPGVGRKTANVILNTAFGHATIAVDTHIFRVANRTGLATGKTPRMIEEQLLKVIPKPFLKDAHHWLVLHGRYICVARKPKCGQCTIRDLCEYPSKTI